MIKNFTCIVCPNGCNLTIEANGFDIKVSGNTCKKGEEFARSELANPERTISSTVRTSFKDYPVLPVRVSSPIPKDKIFDVMKEINKVCVDKRLKIGDIVIENVLGLNVNVIAISNM